MGGHNGGEVASQIVIETIKACLEGKSPSKLSLNDLKKALSLANKKVWEKACRDSSLKGMGSTATLVVIAGNQAFIGHVGDSRAYLFREGVLEQLTKDHSYVQILVESGYITPEEALHHPHRNIITRAVGTENDVDADVLSLQLQKRDVLLLCSDGLNNVVTDPQIADILKRGIPEAADKLIGASLDAGGPDNISVVIAQLDGERL